MIISRSLKFCNEYFTTLAQKIALQFQAIHVIMYKVIWGFPRKTLTKKEGTSMNVEAKTVDESRVETVHLVRPTHLNGANRLFGGILMQWIDEVAGIVAKRHSMCNVTTASVDNLTFMKGAYQGDMVVIKGKMTWVGSSSMEVCVDTYVESRSGHRERINNAHFMMIALDENDKPVKVPRLILQTDDEHLAWSHGEERKRIRDQRKRDQLDWS